MVAVYARDDAKNTHMLLDNDRRILNNGSSIRREDAKNAHGRMPNTHTCF